MSLIKRFRTNPLLKNTIILSIGGILAGAINYVAHPVLARIMDLKTYSEFEALFAILYVGSVPAATIITVIKKYTSSYLSQEDYRKIRILFTLSFKYISIFGLAFVGLLIITRDHLASFLQLSSGTPIIILAFALLFGFLVAINNGILHGHQKFLEFSYNNLAGATAKVIFIVLLIYAGFALNGAIMGLVLAALFLFSYSFWQIKFIFKAKKSTKTKIDLKCLARYTVPTFFILLFFNLLYNLDIILIKHYFSPEESGLYSAMAVIGRLIFFVTGSITLAMFPMTSYADAKNAGSGKILINSLLLLMLVSAGFLIAFFTFPELIIKILIGSKFTELSQYLGWFGMAMVSLSILNLLVQYLLSVGKTRCVYFLSTGPLLLLGLIYRYHASLWEVIWVMNSVLAFLIVGLGIYTFSCINKRIDPEKLHTPVNL